MYVCMLHKAFFRTISFGCRQICMFLILFAFAVGLILLLGAHLGKQQR